MTTCLPRGEGTRGRGSDDHYDHDHDHDGDGRPPHLLGLGDEEADEEDVEEGEGEGEGTRASSARAMAAEKGRHDGGSAAVDVGTCPAAKGSTRGPRTAVVDEEDEKERAENENDDDDDRRLLVLVDELYLDAIDNGDVGTMTVGDVHRAVATRLGLADAALDKRRRRVVKGRLTDLITGAAAAPRKGKRGGATKAVRRTTKGGDDDDDSGGSDGEAAAAATEEEEEGPEDDRDNEYDAEDATDDGGGGDDGSSDYEEEEEGGGGRRSRNRRVKRTEKSIKKTRRPAVMKKEKKNKKKKRMAEHIRERYAKARAREEEEEEEGKKKVKNKEENYSGPRISEEDCELAQAIAARFDTDREELRIRRVEDRVGLIDRLRTRRLEIIASSGMDVGTVEFGVGSATMTTNANVMAREDEDGRAMPRLTSTDVVEMEDGGNDPSSEDDEDDDGDDDDDDDDLEIIAPPAPSLPSSSSDKRRQSTVDLLFQPSSGNNKMAMRKDPQKSSRPAVNPRAALQNALRVKFLNTGNRWLARELGYKDEEDHIRDCKEVEEKKRKQILLIEKATVLREREAALLRGRGFDNDEDFVAGEVVTDNGMVREGGTELNEKEYDDEEDEEMAVARELEQLETGAYSEQENDDGDVEEEETHESLGRVVEESQSLVESSEERRMKEDKDPSSNDNKRDDDTVKPVLSIPAMVVTPSRAITEDFTDENLEDTVNVTTDSSSSDPFADDADDDVAMENSHAENEPHEEENCVGSLMENDASKDGQHFLQDQANDTNISSEAMTSSKERSSSKKPKNSAWQAILQKEKAALAKQKKLQRKNGGLVEGEAEEEEEEEGIVGLEDFGFAVSKKKDDDDEDVDGDVDDDDLDHVVDDLSDGEGDEEAGEVARKRLEQAEEKERHKEIMRRMREGYDGRRGGIASGVGGARGMHRFDQLVAADNRDDAKRLGLLNDDELNSDGEDEGDGETNIKKKDDDEDDEAALLDKMLKERFLNRDEEVIEEEFTDDEESEDELDGTEQHDGDDNEEREQDRLAKYFSKRARRNRILEEFVGDSQFSRSRLIDEDVTMQQDLKSIKTSFSRKRSIEGSNLDLRENNCSSKKFKTMISHDKSSDASKTTSSLSVALMASRHSSVGRKRMTTFLSGNGSRNTSFSRQSSSSSKSVSLNHVVFTTGDNSQSASRLPDSAGNSHSFLGPVKLSRGLSNASKKNVVPGGSLWSRVCSKNFRT
ncbi:hypothetical protein ACHAW5_002181 [Stephanodiscus triporus]|uniref:DNA replication checkpoint mediator MRC1 domain-containing protein n=1 Tax=Stephanodiscus triporus TaxID=2934178 RepID=A0ABD3NMC5_9STRA